MGTAPPLFVGSHPAIDFLNTLFAPDGQETETIPDGRSYLDWLVAAGLLTDGEAAPLVRRFGIKALDSAAAEARKVREWVRSWLDRWSAAPGSDYGAELAALNKLLGRRTRFQEIVTTPEGLELVERSHFASADTLLSLVAAQIAALLAQEDPSLMKRCAGPGCTLSFLDRTKAHRRMFCSAATCGNRAKVAAFRERQRQR